MVRAAVIGAGSWGTAMASLLGEKGVPTMLWARSEEVVFGIESERRNPRYLTGLTLPPTVTPTTDPEKAVDGCDLVVMATPSQGIREAAEHIANHVAHDTAVVSLSKGLEQGSLLRMTEVLADVLGNRHRLAALSGPNHAEEVALGIPTATVIAAYDEDAGRRLRAAFATPVFRVYTNPDVIGVELAAASKNVIAVAAGMSDGLGYGDNTKATLMTRGLAEMSRVGRRAGADPLTYMGLAGMGDLIATCTSPHSRNRGLGEHVARGGTIESYYDETHMVAEGAVNCVTVQELGRSLDADLPITNAVRSILHEGMEPRHAVTALMSRDATDELHGMDLADE